MRILKLLLGALMGIFKSLTGIGQQPVPTFRHPCDPLTTIGQRTSQRPSGLLRTTTRTVKRIL